MESTCLKEPGQKVPQMSHCDRFYFSYSTVFRRYSTGVYSTIYGYTDLNKSVSFVCVLCVCSCVYEYACVCVCVYVLCMCVCASDTSCQCCSSIETSQTRQANTATALHHYVNLSSFSLITQCSYICMYSISTFPSSMLKIGAKQTGWRSSLLRQTTHRCATNALGTSYTH